MQVGCWCCGGKEHFHEANLTCCEAYALLHFTMFLHVIYDMNIQVTLIVAVVVAVLDSTSTSTSMMKTMMSIAYLHFTICNAVSLVFASHHGFTFVVTWSEQSSRFSNVHLVQDTPSQIVIHNAMNYRAFCFEGLEVLTFFFLSADSRCILPHPWFCRNQIT